MTTTAINNSGYQLDALAQLYTSCILRVEKLLAEIFLDCFAVGFADESVPADKDFDQTALLDIQDVKNTLGGDNDAYKRIVERHQAKISAMMWRFSRDRLVHEELVQEVFVQVYMSLHSFKRKAPFKHWLARIATRVGFTYWKNKARQNKTETFSLEDYDQSAIAADDNIEPDQAGELLHKVLDMLPPRDRLVLTLRFLEQNSIEETAQLAGWSTSMVKVQTWRAKKKLRKLFEEHTANGGN